MRLATVGAVVKGRSWHCVGVCPLCGQRAVFLQLVDGGSFRDGLTCTWCRSATRKRHVALAVQTPLGYTSGTAGAAIRTSGIRALSTQSGDALAVSLRGHNNYETSDLIPGVPLGTVLGPGSTCQDLERLTLHDASFDLILTEDVLEHVRRPEEAFAEIRRVLVPGGHHIFTIPYTVARETLVRVDTTGGQDVHLLPPQFHGDPIRGQILAYRTFGTDLLARLASLGLTTTMHLSGRLEAKAGVYESIAFVSTREPWR